MVLSSLSRRGFLTTSVVGIAGSGSLLRKATVAAEVSDRPPANRGRIFKSIKWGMFEKSLSVEERFQLAKVIGLDGLEFSSPSESDVVEVSKASQLAEIPVHGVVDEMHWRKRLSSPDETTREKGRQILAQAIRDSHAVGGSSVLLVPGRVTGADETHEDVWNRSIPEIRQVLPLASRLGVRILIENVWNGFCETPEQLRDYLDALESPWVGAYFDIGNVVKFSPSENWIRTLGHRIVKLDVKDWGRENGFCKIGDGDVNWPEVRKALAEIRFSGWCTAEVEGGDRARLADVTRRMNQVLDLQVSETTNKREK